MKIKEYQMKELDEARRLQQECLRLHLSPPPVLHWKYEITDEFGGILEIGRGKANSYTRNALNMLAYWVGLCDYGICNNTSFGDGNINHKATTGTLYSCDNATEYFRNRGNFSNPVVILGTSNSAESLDSYALPSSGLTAATNSVVSAFNNETRKLITSISRSFYNGTAGTIDIYEAAVTILGNSLVNNLVIRDVFAAVSVLTNKTINWTYTTEVAFPNP